MTTPQTAPRRAAVAFIFVTVVLDMLALGLILPMLPTLVLEFLGGDTPRASEIYGLFGTVWALMQFVCSPLFGALSDRIGRRPVILMSNIGLGLDYVLMALAPTLAWLFAGRVISGITAATFATANAYIADVTPPERRAASFGLLGVAFGIGFIAGPALGGLLGAVDARLSFWVAAALSLANALYGIFVLPESLPRERRAPLSWARANPVGSLMLLRAHPQLFGLAAVLFLQNLAHTSLPAVFVLYAGYRYGWDERSVGLALAGVGIAAMIVQGGLVKPATRLLGERSMLVLGLIFGAAGFAIYAVAPTGALFCIGIPVMALWGLAGPAAHAMMSRRVDASAQGRLQGANGSLLGMAGLLGPGLFTLSFAAFIGAGAPILLPGAPFLLAAVLLAAAALIGARATRAQ
ncbi:MAG: TCR/Tet family MFS transporter [Alphaproteobacteria bacterium]|nr:TCR/Tet family MFS transporter [Alphaproteobacteria bacterium]